MKRKMILPRPPLSIDNAKDNKIGWDRVRLVINDHFKIGDKVTVIKPENGVRVEGTISSIGEWSVECGKTKRDKIKRDKIRFGLLRFYCWVVADLPVVTVKDKPTPCQWLLTGIDGKTNLDRLCEAWAKNDELVPRDNENGKVLRAILDEMNKSVSQANESETINAYDLIDSGLGKYNSYMEGLIINSKNKGINRGINGNS